MKTIISSHSAVGDRDFMVAVRVRDHPVQLPGFLGYSLKISIYGTVYTIRNHFPEALPVEPLVRLKFSDSQKRLGN